MTFTAEDVLKDRGTLRERAQIAAAEKKARIAAEHAVARRDIWNEMTELLHESFEMTWDEIEAIATEDAEVNYSRPAVAFEIEGLNFRGRFDRQKVATIASQLGEAEKLYENVLVLEVKKGSSWKQIKTLAELGEVFA